MNMIFSADENWAIGKQNQLLYHIPPDLRMFMEKTMGGAVIMGRKTWESLPNSNPLSGRVNIILTRQANGIGLGASDPADTRVLVGNGLDDLAQILTGLPLPTERVWVIGGAEVYRLLMPYCEKAYVTRILAAAPEADCWMEDMDHAQGWILEEQGAVQEWEGLRFRYDRYRALSPNVLSTSAQQCQ